jgi:phosphomannomutase/phosphoglucomutase
LANVKSFSTNRYAWIATGGAIIALLMAALTTQFLLIGPVKQSFVTLQANAQIDQMAAQFNQKQRQIQFQLRSIATDPNLIQLLQQRTEVTKVEEQRLIGLIPGAIKIRLNPLRSATIEADGALPFTYTAMDMVNRAEQGKQVYAEAVKVDNRWILSMVQPVNSDRATVGTLFVYLDVIALVGDLHLDTSMGQITLKQHFGQSDPSILFQAGTPGVSGTAITRQLDSPAWEVEHVPSDKQTKFTLIQPMTFWLPLMVFFPISLLGALVSVWLFSSRIETDSLTLVNQIRFAFKGKHSLSDKLELSGFADIDQNLAKMQREFATATATASRPVQPTGVTHEEMVDIEMFDRNEDPETTESTNAPEIDPLELHAIFRAYDIRGIVNETLTPESIYRVGQAIATTIIAQGESTVLVGADGRISSPAVSESLIQGLLDSGLEVTNLGMVPTPAVYFAIQSLGISSAVMVTASHNPPEYNGFKIIVAGQTLAAEEIQQIHQNYIDEGFEAGEGTLRKVDVIGDYVDSICADIVIAQPLNVVIDCGNGVAGAIAPDLFADLGCEVTPIYCDVDGNFPHHDPDPSDPSNLEDLMLAVTSNSADLGIAFDGDGDRLVVITNAGNIIWPDRLLMLFAKDILSRNPGADVVYDIKCSRNLNAVISSLGGRPIVCRSGHSYLKAKVTETGALLGGEMSGHVCFKERWNGSDDGLYAAARLLEIVGAQTKNLEELFDTFPKCESTAEIKVPISDQDKFAFMDSLSQKGQFGDGNINDLDGIRVDYADGWGLIRASNTTPNLTLRFEADDHHGLQRIKSIFMEQMLSVDDTLEIEF